MSLSTAHLRDDFKTHLEHWEDVITSQEPKINQTMLIEIQNWSTKIEKFIQEKIRLLEIDFNDYQLKGEYLNSVSEGFADLERIMRTEKTLLDTTKNNNLKKILENVKHYYTRYFVPLFNILARLENDYIAVTTNSILENTKKISTLERQIKALKTEKRCIKNRLLSFIRTNIFDEISENIDELELQRKLLRTTMLHDRLNLYYFNHERPLELKEIKEKADRIRKELRQTMGENHANHV